MRCMSTIVDVHWNLLRRTWSVFHAGGRLLDYRPSLVLRDCVMRVSASGRERAVRERVRNVHALIRGTLADAPPVGSARRRVTYNPFRAATFTVDGEPVHSSPWVLFESDGSAWLVDSQNPQRAQPSSFENSSR